MYDRSEGITGAMSLYEDPTAHFVCTHTYVYIHTYIYTHMHLCMCIYIHAQLFLHFFMLLSIPSSEFLRRDLLTKWPLQGGGCSSRAQPWPDGGSDATLGQGLLFGLLKGDLIWYSRV